MLAQNASDVSITALPAHLRECVRTDSELAHSSAYARVRMKMLVHSDWMASMLFGPREFVDRHISNIARHYRAQLEKSSAHEKRGLPRSVAEAFDILIDGNGTRLRELVEHSMLTYEQRIDADTDAQARGAKHGTTYMDNAQFDAQVRQLVEDCDKVCGDVKRVQSCMDDKSSNDSVYGVFDEALDPEQRKGYGELAADATHSGSQLPPMSKVELIARCAFEDIRSGNVFGRSAVFMQYIFMTMLNVHVRARGIRAACEQSSTCMYEVLVKEIRDAFVMAAPVLWTDLLSWLCARTPTSPNFAMPRQRVLLKTFLQERVSKYLSCLCSVSISKYGDNVLYESGMPVSNFVADLRADYYVLLSDQLFALQFEYDEQRKREIDQRMDEESMQAERDCARQLPDTQSSSGGGGA